MGYLRVRVGFEFVYGTPNLRELDLQFACDFSSNILNPGKKHTHTRDILKTLKL